MQITINITETSNGNKILSHDETQLLNEAIKWAGMPVKKVAEELKKTLKNEDTIIAEFKANAFLHYYGEVEKVRNYMGKKGNEWLDMVLKKYHCNF